MTIKWDCGKQGCYCKTSLPDWSMLDGCFEPTKVSPQDIDGEVHQRGKFLNLEKKFPNGVLEPPQMRSIKAKVAQGNSVIVIWCERTDGKDLSHMRVFGIEGYDSSKRVEATLEDFRSAAKKWWTGIYKPGQV